MTITARINTWHQARNYLSELQDQLDDTNQGDWSAVDDLNEAIHEQLYTCVAASTLLVGELLMAAGYDLEVLETKLGSEKQNG